MRTPRRPMLQFGLMTLLGAVAIAAFTAHWFSAKMRADAAESEYGYIREGFSMGVKAKEDIYHASVDWLNAAIKVPFSERRKLYTAHIERIKELEDYYRGMVHMAMYDDEMKRFEREANEAARWRREAEEWAKNNDNGN